MKGTLSRFRLIIFMSGSLLASPQDVLAGPHEIQRESLRGLTPIALVMAPLPQLFEKNGTTRQELYDLAKHEFDGAGVRIASEGKPPAAQLTVVISGNVYRTSKGAPSAYLFTCDLSLYQPVALLSTKHVTSAITWRTEIAGLYPSDIAAAAAVKEAVDKSLDEFLEDYGAVNPKAGAK